MLKENALRLELHRGGKVDVLEIHGERALVGSGAHCDVRLLPDEAAVEQLIVEARDEEVFVKLCSFEPPCLMNGAPFLEGRLSPDALLELGSVAIRVRVGELTQVHKQAQKAGSQTHPVVQAIAVVGLVFGFYFVLNQDPPIESALDSAKSPPKLFGATVESCPQATPEAARSFAEQAQEDADNKRERSPFYPRDGLKAVPLYERAAACYEVVGERAQAEENRQAARALKTRLADELHLRHVRIERFIAQRKYDDLRHEALLAAEFVEDKADPYASWLSALARETEVRTLSEKRK